MPDYPDGYVSARLGAHRGVQTMQKALAMHHDDEAPPEAFTQAWDDWMAAGRLLIGAGYQGPVAMPGPTVASGGGSGPVSLPYKIITKPQHQVRRNAIQNGYDVTGPGGWYRFAHHKDEAEAIAAFWSLDDQRASEHRVKYLAHRGLVEET